MKKLARRCSGILIASVCVVENARAQMADQDALVFSAAVQHLYDSNFFRSPEQIEEQITRAGAGIRFGKQFAAQRVAVSTTASQYRYAEEENLNTSTLEGKASWRSQFTSNASTQVDWQREEVPVDKLEFVGKDVIAREDANALLSIGDSKRVGFILGYHQLDMTHSNVERRSLDFQDRDFFSEIRYRLSSDSWFGLRYRDGDRQHHVMDVNRGDVDFDYHQWELETQWALTPKTTLTGLVGYFDRNAKTDAIANNDGEGNLASLKMEWAITEKLTTDLVYRFNQPAIGETSDSPAEVSDGSMVMRWQFTSKLQLECGTRYAEFYYEERVAVVERTERLLAITPLQVSWAYSDAIGVRVFSQWIDRSSPLLYRDYQGYSVTLAFAVHL